MRCSKKICTKKLFQEHTPGARIAPPRNEDTRLQLRLDAGEVVDGKKNVYLQVNSEAKNEALKDFKAKYGTHANLAVATIDENTPPEQQEDAAADMFEDLSEQAKEKLG